MKQDASLRTALIVTAISVVIGASYFTYISAIPFPHDLVRVVPFVWLLAALTGFTMVVPASRTMSTRARLLLYVLAVVNILLAGAFSLGALMGD